MDKQQEERVFGMLAALQGFTRSSLIAYGVEKGFITREEFRRILKDDLKADITP
jgi:hypothetical protein